MPSTHDDEKKKEKESGDEKEGVPTESIPTIKQEILRSGLELNVPPPPDLSSELTDMSLTEAPVQMALPPTQEVISPPPLSTSLPPPRDKILLKMDELLSKARGFEREYKYEAALQQIIKGLNLLEKTKYHLEYAQILYFGGRIYNLIKKSDEAKSMLQRGLSVLEQHELAQSKTAANLKMELGIAYQNMGQFSAALTAFTEAGELFKQLSDQTNYLRSLWNKGITYYNLQDWKNAINLYLEIARESAKNSSTIATRLKSLQRLSDLIQMVGSRSGASFDSNEYLKEIDTLKIEYEEALAHEVRRITKGGELERLKAEAARDPANLALWHFNLAAAELTAPSGDLSSATKHYNQSITLYKEIGDRLGLSRCYQHLAYIKEKQGNIPEAISYLKQCIELREDLKETLKTEEYRTAMQAEIIPIYDELSYLESQLNNYTASLNAIEQSKSRELINILEKESIMPCPYVQDLLAEEEKALAKLRDLEVDLFHFRMRYSEVVRRGGVSSTDEKEKLESAIAALHNQLQDYRRDIWLKCVDSGAIKPPIEYNIFSQALDIFKTERNWAILEFIWNTRRAKMMIFYITPSEMKRFDSELSSETLTSLLKKYQTALIEQDAKMLQNSSLQISEKLIPASLYDELEKYPSLQYLFIIPHKELHSIPFEIVQHKNSYWGLKYSLVKNFSLDLARITLQKRREFLTKHPKAKNSALVVGNPTGDLLNAEIEAKEISQRLKQKGFKVKLLLKSKSKEDSFVKNTRDQTIIHFAGHGIFITPEPILSHLQFATSSLTAREIAQLKLKQIPIVVLSACETAIPGYIGGNELVGFVRSFILAGATSLVSTNWPVSDVSARELIEKFYENLLLGASIGISLQKARQYIAQKYHHQILHWAAYTLFGDPFRQILS
ncbi:MAG: CHAT domain-containing protein [Candidatus Helarchaeota archaeon]